MDSDISLKSKKQDILDAYNRLLKKNQELKKNTSSKTQIQREKEENDAIIQVASESSPEQTISQMSQLKISIGKTIDDLTSKLAEQSHSFHELKRACELEQEKIENNFEISIVAQSTELMIEDHEKKKAELEQHYKLKKEQLELDYQKQENILNEKILALEIDFNEKKELLQKKRKREQEDFDYQQAQKRKKDADDYTLRELTQERELEDKKIQLEKSWNEREKLLKQDEDELQTLRHQAESYPNDLESAKKLSYNHGFKDAEAKYVQEKILADKDFEGQSKLHEMKIKSLEEHIIRQDKQIETLTMKLENSVEQVQQIANKAIEGAAGSSTLHAVNKIAMEQAKGSLKSPN